VALLIDGLLMSNAAPLVDKVQGGNGYSTWFQEQGPRDERGRSLRALDLNVRLFRYPLSFLIYSEGFDALPDPGPPYDRRSAADRRAAFDILQATKPQFARELGS
jgi:hypothetical protein